MEAEVSSTERSILIINPNTSTSMTEALKPLVDRLQYTEVSIRPSLESVHLFLRDVCNRDSCSIFIAYVLSL